MQRISSFFSSITQSIGSLGSPSDASQGSSTAAGLDEVRVPPVQRQLTGGQKPVPTAPAPVIWGRVDGQELLPPAQWKTTVAEIQEVLAPAGVDITHFQNLQPTLAARHDLNVFANAWSDLQVSLAQQRQVAQDPRHTGNAMFDAQGESQRAREKALGAFDQLAKYGASGEGSWAEQRQRLVSASY